MNFMFLFRLLDWIIFSCFVKELLYEAIIKIHKVQRREIFPMTLDVAILNDVECAARIISATYIFFFVCDSTCFINFKRVSVVGDVKIYWLYPTVIHMDLTFLLMKWMQRTRLSLMESDGVGVKMDLREFMGVKLVGNVVTLQNICWMLLVGIEPIVFMKLIFFVYCWSNHLQKAL